MLLLHSYCLFSNHFSFSEKSSIETFDDEQFEVYSIQQQQQHHEQLQQQHTNQQHHYHPQLPQTRNKRLEKLKKLKLREIQSLALEGGDTGRGYCSCDEQWNGSTSSASSPTSVSPTEQQQLQQQQQQQEEPSAQEEPQGQLKPHNSMEDIFTAATATTSPTPSTRTIIMTTALSAAVTSTTMPNNNIEAQEKTSENGSETNDATGGSGYNRTNKQCNGSVAMTITTSLLKQQQQQHQQHEHQHNEHDKLNRMRLNKLNETNNFSDTIRISPGSSSSNIKTITLRRNPIQQRLKQQHHVRFSDEKNFSD